MRALLLHRNPDFRVELSDDVPETDLPRGDVLIDVTASSLNYKDGLAVTDKGKIVRGDYPFVPGIDLVGTVVESRSSDWNSGETVVLTGSGTGESRWGGYATRARATAESLVTLPQAMSPEDAMLIGTAGFTAMLSMIALERSSVRPGEGDVVVTGATGGVGSFSVALLASAGYRVVASTGSEDKAEYLKRLGVADVIGRDVLGQGAKRPLDSARWAGAIDSVGGETLAAILSQTSRHGAVAACGLAGGAELKTTVFPFILRGVALLGIDSNTCPPKIRQEVWNRLGEASSRGALDAIERTTIGLSDVPDWSEKIVAGETVGRVVVDVHA